MTTRMIRSLVSEKALMARNNNQHQRALAKLNRLEGGAEVVAAPLDRKRVKLKSKLTISMPF